MLAITPARTRRRPQVLAFPSGRMLGIVPPDSAFADLVMPRSMITGQAGFRQADYDGIVSDVARGYVLPYSGANPLDCAKAGKAMNVKGGLTKMGSGIALQLVQGGAVAGPAAPFVIAAGVILGLFSAIFNHHALAVAREQGTLCAAVPAANAALTAINQAAQDGTITPAVASASMQQVLQDFLAAVAPIKKEGPGQCNAACVVSRRVRAIVGKYQAVYAEAQAKGGAPGAAGATSFGSILPWAAAAGLLLYAAAS